MAPNTRRLGGTLAQPANKKNSHSPQKTGTAPIFLDAVGLAEERERMRLYSAFRRICCLLAHALHDVARGDRAVGADIVCLDRGHLPEYRPADLHGIFEVLGFYAPGAVVP